MLPRATHYLVHPVLSDVIGHLNPGYPERIDGVDIVGTTAPGVDLERRQGRHLTAALCLKGDVKGFGGVIRPAWTPVFARRSRRP